MGAVAPVWGIAGETAKLDEPIATIQNQYTRVSINLKWGGAITHVSIPGGPNLINSFDLGRQIQQSYYSGPSNYQRPGKEKSKHWAQFPWNPIQTGDDFKNGSKVLEHHIRGNELYVKTVPMLWPMNNDPAECVMETWITLSANAHQFNYRARLNNARSDRTQYPNGWHQEVPAIYTNGPWHRLVSYTGDEPFSGKPVFELRNEHKEPWPWINLLASEGWAALVNDAGSGIGVCTSSAMEFHGGFAGKRGQGGEKSANTGYMSPMSTEILDHNITYEYNCTFILGDVDHIRATAVQLAHRTLPVWSFVNTRQGWTYENGEDAGWPIRATQGLQVKAIDPKKPVRLLGPLCLWRAENANTLSIKLSTARAVTVKVFWRGMPPAEASSRPSLWAQWRSGWWKEERSATISMTAGANQVIKIKLSGLSNYRGAITGLALDVSDGVSIHEIRLSTN